MRAAGTGTGELRTAFVSLDGGSALRIDGPDGGCTVVVQSDAGWQAVVSLEPHTRRKLANPNGVGRRPRVETADA